MKLKVHVWRGVWKVLCDVFDIGALLCMVIQWKSTNVGVWVLVLWQQFATEELSVGKDHKEESRMTYTQHTTTALHLWCCAYVLFHKHVFYTVMHVYQFCYFECRQAYIDYFVYFESKYNSITNDVDLHVHAGWIEIVQGLFGIIGLPFTHWNRT